LTDDDLKWVDTRPLRLEATTRTEGVAAAPIQSRPAAQVKPAASNCWQFTPGSSETCDLCGEPASYHYSFAEASFHLCSRDYYTHEELIRPFITAEDLQAALDRIRNRTLCFRCDGEVNPTDDGDLLCALCGSVWKSRNDFEAAKVVAARRRAELQQELFAIENEKAGATPEVAGDFDCPRCGVEKIVHANGGAWCLNCGAKWSQVETFKAELGNFETQRLFVEVTNRFAVLARRATPAQLEQVSAWLSELEERVVGSR
jgi:hypothetical protein